MWPRIPDGGHRESTADRAAALRLW